MSYGHLRFLKNLIFASLLSLINVLLGSLRFFHIFTSCFHCWSSCFLVGNEKQLQSNIEWQMWNWSSATATIQPLEEEYGSCVQNIPYFMELYIVYYMPSNANPRQVYLVQSKPYFQSLKYQNKYIATHRIKQYTSLHSLNAISYFFGRHCVDFDDEKKLFYASTKPHFELPLFVMFLHIFSLYANSAYKMKPLIGHLVKNILFFSFQP